MQVSVKSNIKEITKWTTNAQKKQIPFATQNAINTTLFQLRKEMGKQLDKKLDRPTPFTKRGFFVNKAKKTLLVGFLIMIHHIIMKLWDVSILRAAEYTFIVCIPVAFWMAEKINERWHDDRED